MRIRLLCCGCAAIALACVLSGCAGTATSTGPKTPPTVTTVTVVSNPTPTPTPMPTPGAVASSPGMFQTALVPNDTTKAPVGSVTVNANADDGTGTLSLDRVAPDTAFAVEFCRFPKDLSGPGHGSPDTCIPITTFTSDTLGNVSVTFRFPQSGTYAGIFVVAQNGTTEFSSGFNIPSNGAEYTAALQPESSITGGVQASNSSAPPPAITTLTSGSVTVNASNATFTIAGASLTNQTLLAVFCGNGDGSSCVNIGSLTTDANGNGSAVINLVTALGSNNPPGVFLLEQNSPSGGGYIVGFNVP